jgi:membrane protein YqaA with SNARE-associated domain
MNMKFVVKNILSLTSGLAFTGLICYGGLVLIRLVFKTLLNINPNLSVAIVAASATILGSTLTIVIGRYYEAKRDREAVHRDKKIELYNEFLTRLFEVFLEKKGDVRAERA